MKTTEKNIVVLNNCAYLFHRSNSNCYFGTKKDNDYRKKINNLLKDLSKKSDLENTFDYFCENEKYYFVYQDEKIFFNDKMIEKISGAYPSKVVNSIYFKSLEGFIVGATKEIDNCGSKSFRLNNDKYLLLDYREGEDQTLYLKKYRSFELESFPKSLRYYRMHFKQNYICFIVSEGALYCHSETFEKIDIDYICTQLDIESKQAKKEVTNIINYLLNY